MGWQEAVETTDDGVTLLLEVSPGAKRAAFPDGFNPWRGRIGIAVRAAAQDGQANQDVVVALAGFFDVPRDQVAIITGASDRRKRVAVSGLSMQDALARLGAHL